MNTVRSKIRDAATLILVARNNTLNSHFDYRVLLLERGEKSAFMPNKYVFPGGVIEEKADYSNDWMQLFKRSFSKFDKDFAPLVNVQGPRPPLIKKSTTDIPSEVALRICAIRETFEESGVLLLRSLTDKHESNLDVQEIQYWRKQVYTNASNFFIMCRELECVPDVWSLSEWSNWLTPTNLARRFDTLFYISFLEKEPTILIDEKEMTHSKWVTPASALLKYAKNQIDLGPPQVYELARFCQFPKLADFQTFQEERASQGCEQWLPVLLKCCGGFMELLPHDDQYVSQKKKMLEELAISSTGGFPLTEVSDTIMAESNLIGTNVNRILHKSDDSSLYRIICNVKLPHRHCSPITDLVRIHELAQDFEPHL